MEQGQYVSLIPEEYPAAHPAWTDRLWIVVGRYHYGISYEWRLILEDPSDVGSWITAPERAVERASALLLLARQAE